MSYVPDWDARLSDWDNEATDLCELCGEWVSDAEATWIDGDRICPQCVVEIEGDSQP